LSDTAFTDISAAKATLLITDFENKSTVIPLIPIEPNFHGIQGHITIGNVNNISMQLEGEWLFDLPSARFEIDVVRYQAFLDFLEKHRISKSLIKKYRNPSKLLMSDVIRLLLCLLMIFMMIIRFVFLH
jgi:hypothetical protein